MVDPPEKFVKDYKQYKDGYLRTMSLRDFLKYEGISKSTYYNYERRILEKQKKQNILTFKNGSNEKLNSVFKYPELLFAS